jgi:hypothetical protein
MNQALDEAIRDDGSGAVRMIAVSPECLETC